MQHFIKRLFKNNTVATLFAIFSFALIYFYFFSFAKTAWVKIDVRSNATTNFKIYWAKSDQPYKEKLSSHVRINYAQNKYSFPLTDLKAVQKLRIDPADIRHKTAKISIKSIVIRQTGYAPIRFEDELNLRRLKALEGIEKVSFRHNRMLIESSGNDPQLEVRINPKRVAGKLSEVVRIVLAVFLLFIFLRWIPSVEKNYAYISYLLISVVVLISFMASISRKNAHPDEYVHIGAAAYYENHWLPPDICAPETQHTYSSFGISRLNSMEIVYPIAGKFSKLLSFLPIKSYLRLRFFNIFLFFLIVLLCFRTVEFRVVAAPLLISPQIWYVFSYFNSDAFSLFFMFIISYQVLVSKSLLKQYLVKPQKERTLFFAIVLGVLFSMLLFSKKNFYFFAVFLLLYFIWWLYYENPSESAKIALRRVGLIIVVVIVIFGLRFVADAYVYGYNKTEKILNCREKLAKTLYKPNTALHEKHHWMHLRERGVPLTKMFTKYRWHKKSFRSSFGVYGYTTISAPKSYYALIKLISVFFVMFIFFSLFIKSGVKEKILFFLVLICSVTLIGTVFWRVWTVMLQAQGRHFLPLVGMIGFLFYHAEKHLNKTVFNTLIISMFLASLYSFVFIGLMNIPTY